MSQQRRRPARTRSAAVQRPRTARPSPPTPTQTVSAPVGRVEPIAPDVAVAPTHGGDGSGMLATMVALGIVVWLLIVVFAIMSAAG